ncbi:hypothetical protein DOY81_012843 [Sarcophaga bullata]|nr:hypothetical protein DOY81_012843 [Sarcophaga bullata]
MKTFKLNLQILIICCALIASGVSVLEIHIGSDGREYLIEFRYKYNWSQAWHECDRWNRQLLTIDSSEKQDVINKVFEGAGLPVHFWLGANDGYKSDVNTEKHFFWSATGKQFTYTNWDGNGPNNNDVNIHCVLMHTPFGKWISNNCEDKFGFICEEKQSLESFNKNPNNLSDVVEKFVNDFEIKFQNLLKDNMVQLDKKLDSIEQVINDTKYDVNILTNITETGVQNLLFKQETLYKGIE